IVPERTAGEQFDGHFEQLAGRVGHKRPTAKQGADGQQEQQRQQHVYACEPVSATGLAACLFSGITVCSSGPFSHECLLYGISQKLEERVAFFPDQVMALRRGAGQLRATRSAERASATPASGGCCAGTSLAGDVNGSLTVVSAAACLSVR